jgi:membrane protein implicated in regulation of membrane protease activity
MIWWGWVLLGAFLLASELAYIDAQFYLVFVGASAIAVGLATHAYPSLSAGLQWGLFGALSVITVLTFRRSIYARLRGEASVEVETGPVGRELVLPQALAPDEGCQVEFRGSHWTVMNGSGQPLAEGTRVRVVRVQGLALVVEPA